MKYRYVKAPPGYRLVKPKTRLESVKFAGSLLLITVGVMVSTTVAYPLISYQITYAPKLKRSEILTPNAAVKNVSANEQAPIFADEVVNTALDYTDSNNWFSGIQTLQKGGEKSLVSTLTIDKLGISRATVRNDHTDLKQSLIQYPGTANPGDLGNTVIFGHSVLPQFFNPQNYITIFSTLHRLEKGDQIQIDSDGASYTYTIYEMYETTPDDLSPLAQTYNGRYLTLITCTPPGTYLRRLIIKAQLI